MDQILSPGRNSKKSVFGILYCMDYLSNINNKNNKIELTLIINECVPDKAESFTGSKPMLGNR